METPQRDRRRRTRPMSWQQCQLDSVHSGQRCRILIVVILSYLTTVVTSNTRSCCSFHTNGHQRFVSETVTPSIFPYPNSLARHAHLFRLRGGATTSNRRSSSSRKSSSPRKSAKIEESKTSKRTATTAPPPPPAQQPNNKLRIGRQSKDKAKPKEDPYVLFLMRLLFLTYYGSLGSLMPYLPVYYHSLGHGGLIIGMLGAVKPLTTFLVAPFWGIVADQTGNKFHILYLTFLVSLIGQLLVAVRHDVNYILAMVFITALVNAPVKSLMDSLVMEQLNDKSQYGRMRLWGQLGFGLGSSGVGVLLHRSQKKAHLRAAAAAASAVVTDALLPTTLVDEPPVVEVLSKLPTLQLMIDYADRFWQNLTGYKLLFSTYAALSIPTWWCLRAFQRNTIRKEEQSPSAAVVETRKKDAGQNVDKRDQKRPQNRTIQGLLLLLQDADAMLFFFLVLVVGISSGIIENFAYVRIREVGGTGKEMGLSRLVSSVAGVPMFWWSGPLTEMFGADRILVWSLLSYVIRFLIYAVMQNAYQGLPAEMLRGVVFAAFWSTGTVYAHRISPPGLDATMLMFLNAMYGGLGQSLGAIIGGKMQSKFGTVQTFVYSAVFDLALVVFVILYMRVRKESNFRNPSPILPKAVVAKDSKRASLECCV